MLRSVIVLPGACAHLDVGSVRWAEKELHMMKLFFDNLQHYIQEVTEHRHKFALWVCQKRTLFN